MELKIPVKLRPLGNTYRITIPTSVVEFGAMQPFKDYILTIKSDGLEISPKKEEIVKPQIQPEGQIQGIFRCLDNNLFKVFLKEGKTLNFLLLEVDKNGEVIEVVGVKYDLSVYNQDIQERRNPEDPAALSQ